MSGVQVHTASPINTNASKSKQTTAEPPTSTAPAYTAASTTAHALNSHIAQPGASAVPAPSAAATSYTPAYTPVTPTRTTTTTVPTSSGPPPPQPGQTPQPFEERGRTMPPAPQPSSLPRQPFVAPIQTQTPQTNYPPPEPARFTPTYAYAQPPKGVTSTAQDLSHPPGYIQNSHASFDDRPDMGVENKTHSPSPTRGGRGLLDEEPVLRDDGESSPIWDTAVSWAKEAGRKLSVVEGEVWKKINGDR